MSSPYNDHQSLLSCSPDLKNDDDIDVFNAFELSTDLVMCSVWEPALLFPGPGGWSDSSEGGESEDEQQEHEEEGEGKDREYDDEEQGLGEGQDSEDGEQHEQDQENDGDDEESGGEDEGQDEGNNEVDEKKDNLDVHTLHLNNPPRFTDGAMSPPVFHDSYFHPSRAASLAGLVRRSASMARDAAVMIPQRYPPKEPEHDERDSSPCARNAIPDEDDRESEAETWKSMDSDTTSDESLEDYEPFGFHYHGLAWRDDPRARQMTTKQMQAQMDAEKEDKPRAYRQPDDLGDVVRWLNDQRERRAVRAAKEGKKDRMHRWAPY